MKKPNKKRTWLARALGAGAMLTTSAVAFAGLLPSMNEKPMPAWTMVYGTEKPQQKPSALLFGVIQPGYAYAQTSNANGTVNGYSQFKFYRVRPGIRGSIGPNIDYFFLAEFANNAANPNAYYPGVTGSNAGTGARARVLDANVTLNYIPGVHVEVGQMLIPFAEEGLAAAGILPWINYSPATLSIDYNEFIGPPGPDSLFNGVREMGVMAFNQVMHGPLAVDYALGYYNGTGLSQTGSSMDHPDQILAHAGVDFGPFGLAGSVENGRQVIAGGGGAPGSSYRQRKYAIDARWGNFAKDPLWAWYEYQHANDTQPGGTSGTARGWFAAAGYRPFKHFMAVFRYSTFAEENVMPVGAPGTGYSQSVSPVGPVLSPNYATTGRSTVSLNEKSLIAIYLARKGVRYYLEYDRTHINNAPNLANDNAVSVMVSLPFGVRLIH